LKRWADDIFLKADDQDIYDCRRAAAKEQLFKQKEQDWLPFGYSKEYLDSMKDPEFWEKEYALTEEYNKKIKDRRG